VEEVSASLHDVDFYAWANEQAGLLRAGELTQADIDNIAEELECLARAEMRVLRDRLRVLLLHLLKWRHQPLRRTPSWRLSILNSRDDLADHLRDNPSLKPQVREAMVDAYRRARREAAIETELPEATFPKECPWTYAEAVDENYWPECEE
jgi:hypothetical protein